MRGVWGLSLIIMLSLTGAAWAQCAMSGIPVMGGSFTVDETETTLMAETGCKRGVLVQVRSGAIYFRFERGTPTSANMWAPEDACIPVDHPDRFSMIRAGESNALLAYSCFQ